MALKIALKIALRSKPRGSLGRFGNMTHSDKGYRQWQHRFRFKLAAIYGEKPLPNFWVMVYVFHSPVGKLGRRNDLDNMIGAVNDALTSDKDKYGNESYGWLQDDSWSYLPRFWGEVISSKTSEIHLYFCKDPLDFLQLFVKLYLVKVTRFHDVLSVIRKIYEKAQTHK